MPPELSPRTVCLPNAKVRVFVTTDTGRISLGIVGHQGGKEDGELLQLHQFLTIEDAELVIEDLARAVAFASKLKD